MTILLWAGLGFAAVSMVFAVRGDYKSVQDANICQMVVLWLYFISKGA